MQRDHEEGNQIKNSLMTVVFYDNCKSTMSALIFSRSSHSVYLTVIQTH